MSGLARHGRASAFRADVPARYYNWRAWQTPLARLTRHASPLKSPYTFPFGMLSEGTATDLSVTAIPITPPTIPLYHLSPPNPPTPSLGPPFYRFFRHPPQTPPHHTPQQPPPPPRLSLHPPYPPAEDEKERSKQTGGHESISGAPSSAAPNGQKPVKGFPSAANACRALRGMQGGPSNPNPS